MDSPFFDVRCSLPEINYYFEAPLMLSFSRITINSQVNLIFDGIIGLLDVNFINVLLHTAFACADPKSVKRY